MTAFFVTVHRNYLKPLISRINTDDPSRNTVFRHHNIKPDLDICCIILIRYFSEVPSRKLPEITTFPLFYDASFNGNNKEPVLKFSNKHIREKPCYPWLQPLRERLQQLFVFPPIPFSFASRKIFGFYSGKI